MRRFAGLLIVLLSGAPALAQPAPTGAVAAPPANTPGTEHAPRTENTTAYFEFLRGRYFEGQGRLPEALEAYERAATADPRSAQIRAEIAGLHARRNKSDEAIRDAQRALELDPTCAEAHWVLGTIYATTLDAQREAAEPDTAAAPPASVTPPSTSSPSAPTPPATGSERPGVDAAIRHLELARPSRLFDNGLHLTLGRLYLTRRNWTQAIDVLSFLVEREPGALEAGYLLAQAYEGAGRRDQAIAGLEQVLEAEPRFFRALLDLADLYIRAHRWDAAAEAYGRAAAEYPNNLDLALRRVAALVNGGRAAEARAALVEAEKTRPAEARILLLRVDVERSLRNYDDAEQVARRLIALQPTQTFGVQALARVFADRRQFRDVVATLEPVVTKMASGADPATRGATSLRLSLGAAYQELREFDKAIAVFESARRDGGDEATIDVYVSQAYTAAGKPAKAAEVAAAARARHPDDLRFLNLEASALLQAGERDRAVALYQGALGAAANNPQVHVAFAGLLLEARDFGRAEQVLTSAGQRFPQEITIPFQLGAVFEEQRRYDEAEQAFRRALALDPQHAPTLNYLGYMFAERGQRLDEAVGLLKQAVDQDPYNGSYLDSLGWAYFKQGALERARDLLVRAGDQMPANSVVQDHVGDVLFALNDRAGAVAAWQRALAGDGRQIERKSIEQKIERARAK
jgi:tetratricopeptide (TPR) repeat protein